MPDPQPTAANSSERRDAAERSRRRRAPKADRLGKTRSRTKLQRLRAALRADLVRPVIDDAPALETYAGDDATDAEPVAGASAGPDFVGPDGDGLPEYTIYRDDGCHVAPACLTCPLPACIFDHTLSPAQQARRRRNRQIRALARKGWSGARLAQRFSLSPAQVRRIRAAGRTPRDAERPRRTS